MLSTLQDTLSLALHRIRVPRLRRARAAEIGIVEKYQRHSLEAVLFALTVGGLSQRKVVGWVQRFLGSTLSVASIGAVLRQAQEQVQARRRQPLSSARYPALAVDGVYHQYRHTGQRGGRPGVLLVAVGVREGGAFDVLDWWDAAEETATAYEQLFTRLWQRGLERVELLISDGAPAILSAAAVVYPGAAHQLCLVHWFRNLEAVTPRLRWWQRRKLRRDFWWIWEADNEAQAREWARRFRQRCRFWAPEMVEKFGAELPGAGLLPLPGPVATPPTHHQLGRRFFQTPAQVSEPLPRLHRPGPQRADPGLLPARRGSLMARTYCKTLRKTSMKQAI